MKQEFILKSSKGVDFFYSKNINENSNVKHFFSTRIGGVSEGTYSKLNLGIYTCDQEKNVTTNFDRIFAAAGMDNKKIVFLKQVHSDIFHIVDDFNYLNIRGSEGDALITSSKGIAIGVFTADCVPILIVDEEKEVIAVVHAGWRGTNLKIVNKVLKYMIDILEVNPNNVKVAIGPSIQKCCFEVTKEVAELFKHSYVINSKWYVDLIKENIDQIVESEVPINNIETGKLCTMCDQRLFYSYRRDNGDTGRLGTFIQLV
jgi:polyphenol oxidase